MENEEKQPVSSDAVRNHYAGLAAGYDRKANRACKRAYRRLIECCLRGAGRVLELGAGATDLLTASGAAFKVACDVSVPMLRARPTAGRTHYLAVDAAHLPFPDARFDGVFCINLLEHVADPARVLAEADRVLIPGGRCLAVTPNGDVEGLLDLLERLHLKLPEGPHRFLTFAELERLAAGPFEIKEHRRFAALPVGPEALVRTVDRLAQSIHAGLGLFQYVLLRKPTDAASE